MSSLFYFARRFKTATALNLIGLTVAFTAFYLFMTQVTFNHSYNRGLTDHQNLYRVELKMKEGWQVNVNRLVGTQMAQTPGVEAAATLEPWTLDFTCYKDETELKFQQQNVNGTTLLTFQPQLMDGTLAWEEGNTEGIIIPASVARTYFDGETLVAGRAIWTGQDSLMVRGVYADFPDNCCMGNNIYRNMGDVEMNVLNNFNYQSYIRLSANADTATVRQAFAQGFGMKMKQWWFDQGWGEYWDDSRMTYDFRLTPLAETYFSGVDDNNDKGNRIVDNILLWACVLLIIVAAINFLNFSLAEAPMRVKGVNTRRVLGSTLESIRLHLLAETVVTALVAFAIAAGMAYLLTEWPLIGELTVGNITLSNHLPLLGWMAVLAVGVGIVAGLYPAFYVTSFQPALALKGSAGLTPRGRQLRTALITLQLLISSLMVVYLGILYLQTHFIFTSDYGFAKDEVLYASINNLNDKPDALRSEMLALTGVKDVAYSQFCIGTHDGYMTWGRKDNDHEIRTTVMPVDYNYLHTMGIKILEGRDFNEHDGTEEIYIINEAARQQWDWVQMDKPLLMNNMGCVVGVCENIRYATTRVDRNVSPMMFMLKTTDNNQGFGNQLYVMNVRVATGIDKVAMRSKIAQKMKAMGYEGEPDVRFLDQDLEMTYQEEFRFIHQVLLFSVICLVITLIGVFCLTLFETEYRRKEIGIRKVFGSTEEAILLMLSRRYAILLLLSFLLAAPIAWYLGHEWLQSFTERTPIYWWLFPLALAAVSFITLATVCIQGWRAATENPVNSIKTE